APCGAARTGLPCAEVRHERRSYSSPRPARARDVCVPTPCRDRRRSFELAAPREPNSGARGRRCSLSSPSPCRAFRRLFLSHASYSLILEGGLHIVGRRSPAWLV